MQVCRSKLVYGIFLKCWLETYNNAVFFNCHYQAKKKPPLLLLLFKIIWVLSCSSQTVEKHCNNVSALKRWLTCSGPRWSSSGCCRWSCAWSPRWGRSGPEVSQAARRSTTWGTGSVSPDGSLSSESRGWGWGAGGVKVDAVAKSARKMLLIHWLRRRHLAVADGHGAAGESRRCFCARYLHLKVAEGFLVCAPVDAVLLRRGGRSDKCVECWYNSDTPTRTVHVPKRVEARYIWYVCCQFCTFKKRQRKKSCNKNTSTEQTRSFTETIIVFTLLSTLIIIIFNCTLWKLWWPRSH